MFLNKTFQAVLISISLIFISGFLSKLQAKDQGREIIIIGGGHLGLVEAYLEYERAIKSGEDVRIKIYEQNSSIEQTTAANIWNSHTPDEIVSVVPRGKDLQDKLKISFDQPGGIRIADVPGINDSPCTEKFVDAVMIYGENEKGHQKRTEALLKLGKAGMAFWKYVYDNADPKLRKIFVESNFNPCRELSTEDKNQQHKGYRIDLIYGIPQAKEHAAKMMKSYQDLGYTHCQILSPDEVEARDPYLAQFCAMHSEGQKGNRRWKDDSAALWRPGGCLDTQTFLPKFADYLKDAMGTYISDNGIQKPRFQIKFNKKVTGIIYGRRDSNVVIIKGLTFEDGTQTKEKNNPMNTTYVFCPGAAVGTLHKLGLSEPAYAGFAGASLSLNVPITDQQLKEFKNFSQFMEVHKVGVVLAWQARLRDGKLFVGGAGTKSYYGDQVPTLKDKFARDRNLLQLNMINDVLPWLVSKALERNTESTVLTEKDMNLLVEKGIANRWVGRRAVAYDGFPTLGLVYHEGKLVSNSRVTTHLGSGGGSFSLIASLISLYSLEPKATQEYMSALNIRPEFVKEILFYADSRR